MIDIAVPAGMFVSAFASATLLPGHSEALLGALLLADHAPLPLLAAASAGNILGSVVNWLIGRNLERWGGHRYLARHQASLDRARHWYQRFGKWSLLLSWVPVIGDPLTLVAGVMREPLPVFLALITVAKVSRYLVVAAATLPLVATA